MERSVLAILHDISFASSEEAEAIAKKLMTYTTFTVFDYLTMVGAHSEAMAARGYYWPDMQQAFEDGEAYIFRDGERWRIELPVPVWRYPGS